MSTADILGLPPEEREQVWARVSEAIESYTSSVGRRRVSPQVEVEELRFSIEALDLTAGASPTEVVDWVVHHLNHGQVQTPHPRYFGLFNPRPTAMGVAADALVAAFNPQLAAWAHSPFACEIERHLIRAFGERFGLEPGTVTGSFTSGGAEANHTALLTALVSAFPDYTSSGTRHLPGRPIAYVSKESHHSFVKAASLCGIGSEGVVEIPLDDAFVMDCEALAEQISRDKRDGLRPFLVVATLGTTNAGLIDPIAEIATIAKAEGLWLHADAAWGGAAMLVPELRRHLAGIERSDSITFDAHKWLSVPMGAGMYLTPHAGILERTFSTRTDYMPTTSDERVAEPHGMSMQWSRRFIGLKVFMSLFVAGWNGYETVLRRQTALGDELRGRLADAGWRIVNETPLPTVCWVDGMHPAGATAEYLEAISDSIVQGGSDWISTTKMGGEMPVLRATITNYATTSDDLAGLVHELDRARETARSRADR